MSTEHAKVLIQRFDDMFNKPDITIADEIFALDFVGHRPITPTLNRMSYKSVLRGFFTAFPDFRLKIHDTIITSDRLVLRVTYYGTHRADFLGIPPTGCEVSMPGIGIFRIEGGLIVEHWEEIDFFGVVQQVSSIPYLN